MVVELYSQVLCVKLRNEIGKTYEKGKYLVHLRLQRFSRIYHNDTVDFKWMYSAHYQTEILFMSFQRTKRHDQGVIDVFRHKTAITLLSPLTPHL